MTKLARMMVAAAIAGTATLAAALEVKPYSADALAQARAAGQPVALHFHADWCPTCRAQDKALQALRADPDLGITVLKVDYDQEKALKREHRVNSQSTLVVFKGAKETARAAGETSPEGLRQLFKTAL